MPETGQLGARLERGEVIVLDGAVGTQLQEMGVPMDNTAWAAMALETHPYTVRRMHELYVSAGVDYTAVSYDPTEKTRLSPAEFVEQARRWVTQGVQIVGGCCGIGVEYIRRLRAELPTHVPPRRRPAPADAHSLRATAR